MNRLFAVHLEPVGTDEVLLVEHGVVRAQESEVLKLKKKNLIIRSDLYNTVGTRSLNSEINLTGKSLTGKIEEYFCSNASNP